MELSPKQRERLRESVLEAQAPVYAVDAVRPAGEAAFAREQKRLRALRDAWTGLGPQAAEWLRWRLAERVLDKLTRDGSAGVLDEQRRQALLVELSAEWDEAPLDLPAVIDEAAAAMAQDGHRPQKTPGLRHACRELWLIWREGEPSEAISKAACEAIGAEVAELFRLDRAEAVRRVRVQLRELDAALDLPRRKGGPEE